MNKIVFLEEHSVRIDKFLADYLQKTRSFIQNEINKKQIKVNNQIIKNNYKLHLNDVITYDFIISDLAIEPENLNLDLIYEDDAIIVVNKKSGMVVHPAPGNYSQTLVNGLLFQAKSLSSINGVKRPGIVHRIDKNTSGLLIVAKTDEAHIILSEMLKNHEITREYYALVIGNVEVDTGTINAPIGRDQKNRKKMCVTDINSKKAITHFETVKRFDEFTLLSCRLETGRTHQIRVHLSYIGHAVYGDNLYAPSKMHDEYGQYLHAYKIIFNHPITQKLLTFEAPLEMSFQKKLDQLRGE